MFGSIGGGEILMILTLALLLFGPRRLPEIGKTLGRTLSEFRKATHDLKNSLEHEVARQDLAELKDVKDGLQSAGRDIAEAVTAANPLGIARGALEETPVAATTETAPSDPEDAKPKPTPEPPTSATAADADPND
jgi:sec-independent protein translocase protein TatA